MLRAAALTLLVVSVLAGTVTAQRAGGMSHGVAGGTVRSGFSGGHGFRGESFHRGAFSRGHFRHDRSGAFFYPYLFPYDEPYDDEEPYREVVVKEPAPAVVASPAPQSPPPEPKIIEVPGTANAAPAKPLPPTVFILTSGERLETRRKLSRANDLSVTIRRQQHIIPRDQIDIDATLAANHERGVDLEIPADPNEISLRF